MKWTHIVQTHVQGPAVYIHTQEVTCACNEILFNHKKRKNFAICIMLNKILVRERQIQYNLIYMWNLKKKNLIDWENRLLVARGRGRGG